MVSRINKNKISKFSTIHFLEYLIWFLIILDFNTVFLYNGESHHYVLISSGLIIVALCLKKRIRINRNRLLWIGVYLVYMLLWNFLAMGTYFKSEFIERFLIFMPTMWFYISTLCELDSFLRKFANIVFILAIVSLFFWGLGTILGVIDETSFTKMFWGTENDRFVLVKNFYNLYFETSQNYVIFGIHTARNDGIFCEGPMYAAVLLFALAYELFYRKQVNIRRIVVLSITMVTTISLTGWIIMLFMYVYKYITKSENTSSQKIVKGIIGVVIVCVGIYIVTLLIEMKSSTESFLIRLDDYAAGFNSWKASPIWGHGYGNTTSVNSFLSSFRKNNTGTSNSLMMVLAQGGLVWLMYYFAGFFAYFKIGRKYHNWNYYGFLIVLIMMFLTVVFYTRLMMLVLLSIGFVYSKKKE